MSIMKFILTRQTNTSAVYNNYVALCKLVLKIIIKKRNKIKKRKSYFSQNYFSHEFKDSTV